MSYEVIQEEGIWKSVSNGKTLVIASTKEACVKQTDHYVEMSRRIHGRDNT